MKLVQVAEQNKKYYTKDFIHGFNTGAKTQLEADKKNAERRGRWVFNIDDEGWSWDKPYMCDQCGKWNERSSKYCPSCGALMVENSCEECHVAQNYNLEDDDSPCQNCGVEE